MARSARKVLHAARVRRVVADEVVAVVRLLDLLQGRLEAGVVAEVVAARVGGDRLQRLMHHRHVVPGDVAL